ncbi:NAD-dependent epimerase/dehydratase family protein [bacterium]|jgi:GDP-L-fucose synthase|nr:NAD-dependent epimerase/dehydratase family protein [bacterium]MBT4122001.1 NAD-dependent epimerase/dehydratase family protein [bacterium]MBT4495515.1 NAD-dependent epimerase/dehydratase family protein [bacterium]MBT4764173.1 NAD-dependent epimerase/dehydratase family protein [bacterium]MBT5401545.1 NAD-dependent epimerase/dehydratase family protein [bacterium]
MIKDKKILVTGGSGFLGKRVIKRLKEEGYNFCSTSLSEGVDFRNYNQTIEYFKKEKPDIVINCATFIGGIKFGMDHRGEIYYNNTLISNNLIEASRELKVERFINPISNCSYPNVGDRKFKEEDWWQGELDESVMVYGMCRKMSWVQAYAYHKQYGMNFINLIIPNMYGPGDHFEEVRSHALGALVMKIVKAKEENLPEVTVWGTGSPVREWLYIDDTVEILLESLEIEPFIEAINIGVGKGVTIKELAETIKEQVGYEGNLTFDTEKPDGAPYKAMDITKSKKIFKNLPNTELDQGIKQTIEYYYKEVLKK